MTPPDRRLGRLLLDRGQISRRELHIALTEQQHQPERLGRLLQRLGFCRESAIADGLAEQSGVPRFFPDQPCMPEALALLEAGFAQQHRLLPVALHPSPSGRHLLLATSEIDPPAALGALQAQLPPDITPRFALAGERELTEALQRHYPAARSVLADADEAIPNAPQLLDELLAEAVRRRASDLHFEPGAATLRIRYRIDGVLQTAHLLHRQHWPALCGRIKILGGMNVAESRAAQDGHFEREIDGQTVDFRAAIQPVVDGENVVLRILDRHKGIFSLAALGLDDSEIRQLLALTERPGGLLLMTGPTGSGKTTTLYALLNRINHEGIHIMTLEDPVEYSLPLIRQTSLTDNPKLDFASGIRSLLRQSPDIILVGEIRDRETAAMSLRAALTGHRVLATLHAGSAIATLARLRELGIHTAALHGNLSGIVAQRLIRRPCPDCRGTPSARAAPPSATACPTCQGSGYRGRQALVEILSVDEDIDLLLAEEAPPRQLLDSARRRGFLTLAEKGRQRLADGRLTADELRRVIGPEG